MKLTDFFKQGAADTERRMHELADRRSGNLEGQQGLREVEAAFREMSADGQIDPAEFESLLSMLEAQGADTDALRTAYESARNADGTVAVDGEDKFSDLFFDTTEDAKEDLKDSDTEFAFRLQVLLSDHRFALSAASQESKSGHDADMTVIRNMLG